MSDYELQFQADLEKAQALSLESLALEQFRQQRRFTSEIPISENEFDGPPRPSRSRSGSGGCPPPLPPPPRRPLRRPRTSVSEGTRSTSGSPIPCETEKEKDDSDLISFTSPSSAGRAHIELKECIEHIHRLNQQTDQLALVPAFKGSVKLARSNSSASSYSTNSNNIPYIGNASTDNFANPLIALPNNSPYAQYNNYGSNTPITYHNLSNSSSRTNIPMINSKTIGFSVNSPNTPTHNSKYSYPITTNIYPTLPNITQTAGQVQYQYMFNRGENNNTIPPQIRNIQNNPQYIDNTTRTINLNTSHQINNSSNSSNALFSSRQDDINALPVRNLSSGSANLNVSMTENFSSSLSDTNLANVSALQKPNAITPKLSKSQSSEITKMNDRNSAQAWSDIIQSDTNRINALYGSIPKVMSDSSIKSAQGYQNISNDRNSIDLIDLAANASTSGIGSVRVSVLEAFDPLMADSNTSEYMTCSSECSSSVYDAYDPLDFLYGGNENARESSVYAAVNRKGVSESVPSPLPSPQPKSFTPQPPVMKRSNTMNSKLYECVTFVKKRKHDPELIAFLEMVKTVRVGYIFSDPNTNPGYVIASKTESQYPAGTSIKLLVYHHKPSNPITFTCDVESTVEHVILHVVCELEGEISEDTSVFTLRVRGMSEYLTPGSCLSEYDYVRQCVRLEKDILLCLQPTRNTSLARTERDDTRDNLLTLEELLPNQGAVPPISYHNLSILLEILESELSRLSSSIADGGVTRAGSTAQSVKAICTLLGGVETAHVATALATLMNACSQAQPDSNIMKPEIVADEGEYCNVTLKKATLKDTIGLHCQRLREAVKGFIVMYCRSNRVDFQIDENHYSLPGENEQVTPLASIKETALFNIEGIHRPPINWNHDEFVIHAQIYHGTNKIKGNRSTQPFPINTSGFYPRIMFETWLTIDEVSIANLPKEARLVLTLSGRTLATPDSQNGAPSAEKEKAAEANQRDSFEKRDNDDDDSKSPNLVHVQQEELGWTSIQLFDYNGLLICGNFILPIWPVCADKRLGPAPDITDYPPVPHPLIHIEIPSYGNSGVCWQDDDESEIYSTTPSRHSFEALDTHTQQQLMHLVDQGPYQPMPSECREILWEKRHYLVGVPGAVPLVLLAAVSWDASSRRQLMYLLDQWTSPTPYDALHLLLPCFPDEGVRARAVRWLKEAHDDTLTTLTPQLCLGLRYERFASSPLAKMLLSRALESPRFAHRLYWQLVHDIPGNSPQNSSDEFLGVSLDGESMTSGGEPDPSIIASSRWVRRNQMLLRALLAIVGENLSERLLKQQLLVKTLTEVARSVKNCKESSRNRTLQSGVQNLVPLIKSNNICLPLSVSQEVYDIDVKSCSYFPSNTLPLKINFLSSDNAIIPAIFKVGDDLRQDSLVLQVMNVMDQLWLKEGLDMRMVTFEAVPTQYRKGMIEMVCSAETLRAIQVEWGLTGSFKDKPIAEWLAKHNPSELEYERAVTNFTASCAGYSVATYLLGICDRHNDNIMLKTSGHLFHIDFGKFLGDAQMFGNFKRDRTPFVLTPDMAYVINGGERPSQKFHHFVELCCTAFNIVRKHHNLILHLFTLMASSGISGVSTTTIGYVRAALLPGQTPAEAAAAFARLIHSALRSRFTPINFFLHNLAQLRAGDQPASSNELLSFMPKVYTMAQEGRLTKVEVLGYEKRYDPEKYYVYALRIFRQGQATPSVLYRSYKHFTELYQKICLHFPLAKVHSLPVGLHMGRSNTKQAAERRFHDVQAFLTSLFYLADEIAHSDLVYTFFHPLLRDQQDVGPQRIKNKNESQQNVCSGTGSLKISIQYSAGVLSVLILHAQSLPMAAQGVPPSPYVKVYLVPDQSKETKRKTRVLKRNCHPSFMEMLEYRLPMEVIRGRSLQATVWHHDPLQENQFLGGVQLPLDSIPLTAETTEWYPLQYIPR